MVLVNGPADPALKPAVILSAFPLPTGACGHTGVVQPQEGVAVSITTGLSLTLVNKKSCVTGTPCLIFPNCKKGP
jgi:hypothetical protein